jgi:PAS domain S-box-containing protein
LDHCVNGVTLADSDLDDCPIIYATKAFEQLTGYAQDDIIGFNCRFLQGDDKDQPQIEQIREGLKNRTEIDITLRHYKKDGTLFHNHLKIKPLFDNKQRLLYFLGIQYDITDKVNANVEIKRLNDLLRL